MNYQELGPEIQRANKIVIIQAENPDGDSLSSSLALEEIFGDIGKEVHLYCPVQIPRHLRFLSGWDRVNDELPNDFNMSVIVDTSSQTLLERVFTSEQLPRLRARPTLVIDHHDVEVDLPYHTLTCIDHKAVATGEVIYQLAKNLELPISLEAAEFISQSIMFDSLGLISDDTTPQSIEIVADLVRRGVSLARLDAQRRELMRKSYDLVQYKAQLLTRIELHGDEQIATITIPWEEIEQFSDQYNPSMLVIDEMRLIDNVKVACAFKVYPDGKVTGKIRANYGTPIAAKVAEAMGGGGHQYAAGFKTRGQTIDEVRNEFIKITLENLE